MRRIARLILRLSGWKIKGEFPFQYKKSVVIEAPHTSMWDFVFGWLALRTLGIQVKFLIKKEMFVWPLGYPLRKLGGIPIDRHRNNRMVSYISELFDKHESLYITITPEGTRKKVEHWKKGFYYIAMHARVPVVLTYLDYGKKEGGVGPVLWPSGDFQSDWQIIETFYRGKKARHPERFNLSTG
ncbi:MAG TPA: 1-acyl-sn-glycerol-3-phosphate acyltransferase [Bacteroidales bacterium]|nr:1-acyl-sn-glycerol-3-phosphate acyltransferase [Bacteroidales bacterium]HSA43971.1 1-acyl-sn-glycerol-3-phosphate acyltransferase [Bacteroidales bacterium]